VCCIAQGNLSRIDHDCSQFSQLMVLVVVVVVVVMVAICRVA
jgi:hypothetical protein